MSAVSRYWVCAVLLAACEPVDTSTPRDCWDADPSAWQSVELVDMGALGGMSPAGPSLSPDALSLYYAARTSVTAPHRVFRATRSDRLHAFVGGEPLASWPGADPIGWPWRVGDELVFNFDHGDGNFELASSRLDANVWSTPEPLGPGAGSDPTLTADGRYLLFARAAPGTTNVRLYEARRIDDRFGELREMPVPLVGANDALLCATISPDGRRLFFSTSYPHALTALPPNGVTIWYSERAHVDHDWGEPMHVAALDGDAEHSCASAVSGDGCELWVQRFVIDGPTHYVVARREP